MTVTWARSQNLEDYFKKEHKYDAGGYFNSKESALKKFPAGTQIIVQETPFKKRTYWVCDEVRHVTHRDSGKRFELKTLVLYCTESAEVKVNKTLRTLILDARKEREYGRELQIKVYVEGAE